MAPKLDKSVEDVEWGDDASGSDESDEEWANEQADYIKQQFGVNVKEDEQKQKLSGPPAGQASSIGEHDIKPQRSGPAADHETFESWKSKGEGEDFGESGDEEEAETKTKPAPIDTSGEAAEAPEGADEKAAEDAEEPHTPTQQPKTPPPEKADDAAADGEGDEEAESAREYAEGESADDGALRAVADAGADGSLAEQAEDDMDEVEREANAAAAAAAAAAEAAAAAAAAAEAEERERFKNLRGFQKVLYRIRRVCKRCAKGYDHIKEHHTKKVRCVLIPLLCIFSPLIIFIIMFRGLRRCLKWYCRNTKAEQEELEEVAREEERLRKQLMLAAGPQRSRLKRPNPFQRFARQRAVAKDTQGGQRSGHQDQRSRSETRVGAGHGGKMEELLRDMNVSTHKKDIWYKHWNPANWPGYFKEWWTERTVKFEKVGMLLDAIEAEEEYDWDTLDEDGNPVAVNFFFPKSVRRKYRFFIFIYWDPILDRLDQIHLFLRALRLFIRMLPIFAFIAACIWFSFNLYTNLQYVQGKCFVERLPESFKTTGMIAEQVEAVYIVKRFFKETPERPADHIIQECKASVSCSTMNYGESGSYDDDRCVTFQSWKLGDQIKCYYDQNDYWGDKGAPLSCLGLPSKMERETFTVAIACVINILIAVILGVYRWIKNDKQRQAKLAEKEALAAEAEEIAAKKAIEEQEAKEALAQEEAVNRELGITDGDEEAADFLVIEMEANEDRGEGLEAERARLRT